jgi:hypothetical protein
VRLPAALGFALVVAVLLAAPATALAGGGFDLRFQFTSSSGYRITVEGYGATAAIDVAKKPDPASASRAWSTYIARGKVSPTAIDADFGARGNVAMRFRPSGPSTLGRRHRHCLGPDRYKVRPGVFVGSVRFSGEDGYAAAEVHRVKGSVITPRFLLCADTLFGKGAEEGRRSAREKHAKMTRLYSFFRSGLTAILFGVSERGGRPMYVAQIEQTVGSLGVFRGVSVRGSAATFAVDNTLSSAGVTPPAPFSGSGSFQRGPTGIKSWTGSLAVSFPGAPNVSLTDPRFKTQLTRSW